MDAGLIQWRSPNSSRYPFFVLTAIWRFVVIQTARQCDSQRESKGYAIAIKSKKTVNYQQDTDYMYTNRQWRRSFAPIA
jgi:hypothetical protein